MVDSPIRRLMSSSLQNGNQPRRAEPDANALLDLPILARRTSVVFPGTSTTFTATRSRSLRAIEQATAGDKRMAVMLQRDPAESEPALAALFDYGCLASIERVLELPDGTVQVWIRGERRIRLKEPCPEDSFLRGRFEPIDRHEPGGAENEALARETLRAFEACVHLSPDLPEEALIAAVNASGPAQLADVISANLKLPLVQKQSLLEMADGERHLSEIHLLLERERRLLEIQGRIEARVRGTVEQSEREFYLREQLKIVQSELGEADPLVREAHQLRERAAASGMTKEAGERADAEIDRLASMPRSTPEATTIRTYVEWLIDLPWGNPSHDNLDVRGATVILDQNHHGLNKVKRRILEYISVRKLTKSRLNSPMLCFVGAPGVGKTSLGRSIAEALGRNFLHLSLGGIHDEAEIRGHRRTYMGAAPGRIIQTMKAAGSTNPVFMLDEIDKLGTDHPGDPSSALLDVLDAEQNHSFSDHYLEIPYDLSNVLFIATANVLNPVIPALLDRLEVIELPGYVEEEKLEIARRFLVPRQLEANGLAGHGLRFSKSALRRIVRDYTHEAGVRNLEREISTVCRKLAHRVASGEAIGAEIRGRSMERYLGPPKTTWGSAEQVNEIGVAMGVARNELGGDTLAIEVSLMDGKGNLILTGQLGDVMRESAQAALSYARSRAGLFNIPANVFDKTDIHIHVPAGATPKDGPSAGITIATAVISALTRKPVRRDCAMTGEITLRGRVLPVSGLREKILAAHRAGISRFIFPR